MNEARYSRLTREFPERASVLFANEDEGRRPLQHLLKLIRYVRQISRISSQHKKRQPCGCLFTMVGNAGRPLTNNGIWI